jgi:hypothetical protein
MKTMSLAYSTRDINRNFRIKVSGVDGDGNRVPKWFAFQERSPSSVLRCSTAVETGFQHNGRCCVCKLRRGIKFSFSSKNSDYE